MALSFLPGALRSAAGARGEEPPRPRYRIAVCDWMILKRQKAGAFALAHEIGADGVEVDMGGLGDRPTFDSKLGDPAARKEFLDRARAANVEISSVAMSGFYSQSFAVRAGIERTLQDCLDTMTGLGVRIAFLPLGVGADLVKNPALRAPVVARLRELAPKAEKAGVVIGIETSLDAAGEVRLLDEIGSPAIRIYFNFENPLRAGRVLENELRTLGTERICQIHATNRDGFRLQDDPQIDMPAIRRALDTMGWRGWLVIERSRSAKAPHNVKANFGANAAYLKSIFQAA